MTIDVHNRPREERCAYCGTRLSNPRRSYGDFCCAGHAAAFGCFAAMSHKLTRDKRGRLYLRAK